LPVLGTLRHGPAEVQVRVPLGWRRVAEGRDRLSFTNGLAADFRSAATLWVGPPVARRRAASGCSDLEELVRGMVASDLWRLMDAGPLQGVEVSMRPGAARLGGQPAGRLEGVATGADGAVRVSAVCAVAPSLGNAAVAVIALAAEDDPSRLAERIAGSVRLPAPAPLSRYSKHAPSPARSARRMSPVPRLSRPARGQGLSARPGLSDTKA